MDGKKTLNRRLVKYIYNKHRLNSSQFKLLIQILTVYLKWKTVKVIAAPPRPLILMVEPANRCNFNCPLCDRGAGLLNRPEGQMSLDSFSKLLDMAGRGLKLLMLWNQGEPFLNKNLLDMVKLAKKQKVFTVISSNGSLIDRSIDKIIESGLDEIIISLDGLDTETYNMYRRGGDFDKIVDNIKLLSDARGGRLKPLISLQFLLLKSNSSLINRFKDFAESIGADRALLKTVQVSNPAQAEEFLPEDNRLSRYTDRDGRMIKRRRDECRRILYSAVIDWNGNMVPCCFDKDEHCLMGNIFEEGFDECWRGEKFRKFRKNILTGNRPAMCGNCTEGLEKLFL
ncbi:MAG: radical SAM protein [FCB group bacterium]|nr:radical SAM protein [FCB group bacterium]